MGPITARVIVSRRMDRKAPSDQIPRRGRDRPGRDHSACADRRGHRGDGSLHLLFKGAGGHPDTVSFAVVVVRAGGSPPHEIDQPIDTAAPTTAE